MASLLSQRLAQRQPTTQIIMYSVDGATFQEKALSRVGTSKAYSTLIGQLVTKINNKLITMAEAENEFNTALDSATSGIVVTDKTIKNDVEIMRDNFIARLQDQAEIERIKAMDTDEFLQYRRESMLSNR